MNLADWLKSLAILIVVIFHVLPGAMPILFPPLLLALAAFFFMSGIFYKQETTEARIRKTTRRLIIPYLLAFTILLQMFVVNFFFPVGSYLWFLWALIIYELSAHLGKAYPLLVSSAIFIITASELGKYLLVFSFIYSLGLLCSPLRNPLTAELFRNRFFEVLGKNTLWIYLLHIPIIQAVEVFK